MVNERLRPSAKQREILQKCGLSTVEELMYADLRRLNWDKADAFYAAFHHLYSDYPLRSQKELMSHLESGPCIKDRISGADQGKDIIPLDELAKATSKEKILSDLLKARKRTREGTKEWNDLTKMIADYAKIKQDEIKTDERPIRYYIPVRYPTSCKNCLVVLNKKK